MTRFFLKIYDFLRLHRGLMWTLLIGSVVVMGALASQLRLHTDISNFLPESEEQRNQEVLAKLKIKDRIIILFSAENEQVTPDDLIAAADIFEDELWQRTDSAHILALDSRIDLSVVDNTINFIYQNLPVFLDSADYAALDSLLLPQNCAVRMVENYNDLMSPMSVGVQDVVLRDPFGLGGKTLSKLSNFNQFDGYAVYDDRLFSNDYKTLYAFIDSQDGSNASALNDELTTAIEESLEAANNQTENIAAECYGVPIIATYNARQIQRDLMVTVNVALLVIAVLILLAFKRKRTILLLILPVFYGALFAAACAFLIQGQISAIAIGTGAVILGVALSYSVHVISHAEHSTDARQVIAELTYPLTIGSITTIGAFVGLQFTSSPLLQDFGLFAASCLIGTTLFCLIFLPHFLTIEGCQTKRRAMQIIDKINSYPYDRNRWLIAALLIVLVVALFKCDDVKFDYDMMKIYYRPSHLESVGQRLQSRPDEDVSVLLVSHGNDAQALDDYSATAAILQQSQTEQKVQKFMSAADFLPTDAVQSERIARWNAYFSEDKIAQISEKVKKSAQEAGFSTDAFDEFFEIIDKKYAPHDLLAECAERPMAFSSLIERGSDETCLLAQVWVDDAQKTDLYAQVATTAAIIDQSYFIGQAAQSISDDFNLILAISSLLIFGVLLISYGRIELALLAFLPMFISWFIILGFMAIFDIEFNIVNIILSTFIFGIGDDFSIFVLDGLRSEYREGKAMLPAHKNAIFFSSLMTVIGMGALLFARHPAVHSLALVSLLGILVVVFVSYILQPLLFRWLVTWPVSKGGWPIALGDMLRSAYVLVVLLLLSLLTQIFMLVVIIIPSTWRWKRHVMCHASRFALYCVHHCVPDVHNIRQKNGETFEKPAIIIANHQSVIDLAVIIGMVPKLVVVTKKYIWNSPFFGWAVRMAGYMHSELGMDEIDKIVTERIAEGYSVLIFPEGTRSEDLQVQRFHKGAFLLAEKHKLDIVPIVSYGNGMIMSKRQPLLVKQGILVVRVLPRVAYDDTTFGTTYQERSKNFRTYLQQQYDLLCDEYNTPKNGYFRGDWRHHLLYKETEIELKLRLKARKNDYFADLDQQIPRTATVALLGCGYAPEGLMLALLSRHRTIVGIDSDAEKVAFCQHCNLPNATFICSDALTAPLPEADFYLISEKNTAIIERCQNAGLQVVTLRC